VGAGHQGAVIATWSAAWAATGDHSPDHGIDAEAPLIVDLHATLATADSDKAQLVVTPVSSSGVMPRFW
jgi:hypothetical protein